MKYNDKHTHDEDGNCQIESDVGRERIQDGIDKAIEVLKVVEGRRGKMSSRSAVMAGFYAALITCGCPQEVAAEMTTKGLHDQIYGCPKCNR